MQEIAPGVHRLGSALVNWYVIAEGDAVVLVDAGFPGHWPQLPAALERLGRRLPDVQAILLTHSHVDHTGFADRLRREAGARVHVHAGDAVDGARRFPPLHLYWRPTSWPLLLEGLRTGMPTTPRIGEVVETADGARLDLPGHPELVHLGGHTPGSSAVLLRDRGVVFTGDNLVTMDPYTRARGPRLMLCPVQHDADGARAALDRLAPLPADVVLPGHGDPWTRGIGPAVAHAYESAPATHPA